MPCRSVMRVNRGRGYRAILERRGTPPCPFVPQLPAPARFRLTSQHLARAQDQKRRARNDDRDKQCDHQCENSNDFVHVNVLFYNLYTKISIFSELQSAVQKLRNEPREKVMARSCIIIYGGKLSLHYLTSTLKACWPTLTTKNPGVEGMIVVLAVSLKEATKLPSTR